MYFTQEDYKKIENWLHRNSVKDTEFQEALPFTGKEIVTVVQDGHNRKVNIQEFINQLYKHGVEDFLNVTNTYRANNITLKEAIRLIPAEARKEGQVITFLNTEGNWEIYQFTGKLNQWNNPTLWNNPFDWEKFVVNSILPDEEDLTKSAPDANGNAYLSLKNRKYEPDKYSGLGRKILRRRVVEIEDPIYGTQEKNLLLQADFAEDNTVYVVRYDFTLNGQDITLPDNSYIEYEGGSISDGNIIDRAGGLSRVVLKKNIINGKNILTQDMVSKSNTIYEIRYDFDLNGEEITIPEGCILTFQGGKFSNGNIVGNNTNILSGIYTILENIVISGTWNVSNVFVEWFGNLDDIIIDASNYIDNAIAMSSKNSSIIINRIYNITRTISINKDITIKGLNPKVSGFKTNIDIEKMFYCTGVVVFENIGLTVTSVYSGIVLDYYFEDFVVQGIKLTNNCVVYSTSDKATALSIGVKQYYFAFNSVDLSVNGTVSYAYKFRTYYDSIHSYIQGNTFSGNVACNKFVDVEENTRWSGNYWAIILQDGYGSGAGANVIKGTFVGTTWDFGNRSSKLRLANNTVLVDCNWSPIGTSQGEFNGHKYITVLSSSSQVVQGFCKSYKNSSMAAIHDSYNTDSYHILGRGYAELMEYCTGNTLSNRIQLDKCTATPETKKYASNGYRSGFTLSFTEAGGKMIVPNSGISISRKFYLGLRFTYSIKDWYGNDSPNIWMQNTNFSFGLVDDKDKNGIFFKKVYNTESPKQPLIYFCTKINGIETEELLPFKFPFTETFMFINVGYDSVSIELYNPDYGKLCGFENAKNITNKFTKNIQIDNFGDSKYIILNPFISSDAENFESDRLKIHLTRLEYRCSDI